MKQFFPNRRWEIGAGVVLGLAIVVAIEFIFVDDQGRSIIQRVVERGLQGRQERPQSETPLHRAAREGDVAEVERLLAEGANPNAQDEEGITPLHQAALNGHAGSVESLLNHDAKIDIQDPSFGMTPLYLAAVAGQDELVSLLKSHGADASIPDCFDQTPQQAAATMRQRETRELIGASDGHLPFDSKAIVMLVYLGRGQTDFKFKGTRVAFAVGDGSLLLTAAHCVTDFIEDAGQGVLVEPLVISSYYGDVFQAEILALDEDADVAVLRTSWSTHPSFPLATERELTDSEEILVAGYPPSESECGVHRVPKEVHAEKLPILKIGSRIRKTEIILGGAKFVGPGWSGSAMILPGSGKAAGVFSNRMDLAVDGVDLLQNVMGCGVGSIQSLLKDNHIPVPSEATPMGNDELSQVEEALAAITEHIEALINQDLSGAASTAQDFVRVRSNSVCAHLFLAASAHFAYLENRSRTDLMALAETSYLEALNLAPENAVAHAGYGDFLAQIGRNEDALAEFRAALDIEPDQSYSLVKQIRLLTKSNPEEAATVARWLVREEPENALFWHELAEFLKATGDHEQEIKAIQTWMKLEPETPNRGPLADALARAGRLDEAEKRYRHNLEDHNCAWCWFAYAKFLIQYRGGRADEIHRALEKAEELNKQKRLVPPEEIEKWRKKLRLPTVIPVESDP
ncbi:MAG: ankyrin repeat domain-containing protein [bacterium]